MLCVKNGFCFKIHLNNTVCRYLSGKLFLEHAVYYEQVKLSKLYRTSRFHFFGCTLKVYHYFNHNWKRSSLFYYWNNYNTTDNTSLSSYCKNPLNGSAHYWQNWKRVLLSCYFHEIDRVEAVGPTKNSKYTLKNKIFVIMWNLGQFLEKSIFWQ